MVEQKSSIQEEKLDADLQPADKIEVVSTSRDIDKGSFISYTVWSKYGLGVFGIAIIIMAIISIFQIEFLGIPIERSSLGILVLSFLILFFCFIADLLRWRDFREWGALGAIIAYLGIFLIFVPIILFIFTPIDNLLTFIIITVGVIIMIIGFASHATELDRKISDQFFIFVEWVKAGGIRQSLSALAKLLRTIMGGIVGYLGKGVKNLPRMIGRFINLIGRSLKALSKGIWYNIHWVGLIGLVFLLFFLEYNFFINLELMIIVGFFFSLGVIYPRQDRVANLINRTGNFVLNRVVSVYSMLTGTKLKAPEAMYCTRCLRGVEKKEFVFLMEVKGTENPPCPFCGYTNWISIYQKPVYEEAVFPDRPITEVKVKDAKIKPEEIVAKEIEEPTVTLEPEVTEEAQKIKEVEFEPSEEVELGEQPIFVLRKNLIELGQRLAPDSKEFRDWHDWFIRQTNLFSSGRMYEKTYRKLIKRYLDFLKTKGIMDLELDGHTDLETTIDQEEIIQGEELPIDREVAISETMVSEETQEIQRDLESKKYPESPRKTSQIVAPSLSIMREMVLLPKYTMQAFWNSFTFYTIFSFAVCFIYGLFVPLSLQYFDLFRFFIFDLGYLKSLFDQLSANIITQMVISAIFGTIIWSIAFIAILRPHFYRRGINRYWTTVQDKLPKTRSGKANLLPFLYIFVIIFFIFSFILILVFVYLIPLIFLYFLATPPPVRDVTESPKPGEISDNRCPSCGVVIKTEQRNCPFCGKKIFSDSTVMEQAKTAQKIVVKKDEQGSSFSESMSVKEDKLDSGQLEVHEEIPFPVYVGMMQQLGQQLASINDQIKQMVEWFFQQTQLYQESQMKEKMYITIVKRFRKFLLELDGGEMQLADLEVLDEFLTLLDGILAGNILVLQSSPSSENLEEREQIIDQEILSITEYMKKVSHLGQKFAASDDELQDWINWFLQQTELFQQSQIEEQTYLNMIERSQKILLGVDTEMISLERLNALKELLNLLFSVFKKKIKLVSE